MFTRAITVVVLVLGFADAALAESISITFLDRMIRGRAALQRETFGPMELEDLIRTTDDAGPFTAAGTVTVGGPRSVAEISAHASQNTTVDMDRFRWSGSGSAELRHDIRGDVYSNQGFATSLVGIGFTLSEEIPYHFTGTVSGAGDQGGAQIALFSGPSLPGWNEGGTESPRTVSRSGSLLPGSYVFFAQARAGNDGFFGAAPGVGAFDFDFSLGTAAPVPEPASLALLGAGLAAAAVRQYRYRTRARRGP